VTATVGTAFVGIEFGLADIPSRLFAALHSDTGAAVRLSFVYWRGGYWRPRTRNDLAAVVAGGRSSSPGVVRFAALDRRSSVRQRRHPVRAVFARDSRR
jgi:hypothetical protein